MHCLGGASLDPPYPMAPEIPALLPVGRGFRFDNFQSRVGIRADGRPPARYHLEQYFLVRGRHVAYPYRHHAGCGDGILRPRFRGSVRALVGVDPLDSRPRPTAGLFLWSATPPGNTPTRRMTRPVGGSSGCDVLIGRRTGPACAIS
jgi:hypothetical protein